VDLLASMKNKRTAYKILVWNHGRKLPAEVHTLRWKDNIKMDGTLRTELVSGEGPEADSYGHGNEPSRSVKCWEFFGPAE
jgi:hypothetical protein